MWIIMSDAMFSIVENRDDKTEFVVRARFEGDIEKVFGKSVVPIVSSNSDYRFRIFADRTEVEEKIVEELRRIDYDNFKNSVKENWRHNAYTKIWTVLYNMQEHFNPRPKNWWSNYKSINNKKQK